ncbi:MAG: toxin-activating lysine-acyltransferase [Pseudomonadota bacterium]
MPAKPVLEQVDHSPQQIWDSTVSILCRRFPDVASQINDVSQAVDCKFFTDTQRPFTVHPNDGAATQVHLNYRFDTNSVLAVAHECGHAVQAGLVTRIRPPIYREISAMLSERAFTESMLITNPDLGEAVLQQRFAQKAQHMGEDRSALLQALECPKDSPYRYRYNYPIASAISAYLDADKMWPAFVGDVSLSKLLQFCVETEFNAERSWAAVVSAAKEAFPFAHRDIDEAASQMVAHLSPDRPQNAGVAAGAFGMPPVIRCRVSAQPEDMLNLAGTFCEALSLQLSSRAAPDGEGRVTTRSIGRQALASSLGHATAIDEDTLPVPVTQLDRKILWDLIIGDAPVSLLTHPATILQIKCGAKDTSPLAAKDLLLPQMTRGIVGLARPDLTAQQVMDHLLDRPDLRLWSSVAPNAMALVGIAIAMMAQAPYHGQFKLGRYLSREILPAIERGQCAGYVNGDGQPIGFVSWAFLDDRTLDQIHATGRSLRADEWSCGQRLFFNDWISDRSAFRPIMSEMTQTRFADHIATSLRRNMDGSVRRINRWVGKSARLTSHRNSGDPSPVLPETATCPRKSQPREDVHAIL